MQSTTTIVCRAFVMVVCLITIPLAALFGTSLPDLVNTLGWGEPSVSIREQGGMAPAYSPSIPDVAGVPDVSTGQAPVAPLNVSEDLPAGRLPPAADPMRQASRTVPASYNEPAVIQPRGNVPIPVNSAQPGVIPPSGQGSMARFEQIQNRLWSLGGTPRLESFGTSRQFYRFQCDMPLHARASGTGSASNGPSATGGGSVAVRHFESTAENSLQAMETVLAEIEGWLRSR